MLTIVCISIPLSILASLCILSLLGQTINVMTLGGLALAVGILVDDATVEVENTHRNMAMRKPLVRAVLDGASQIAIPTFVSTLSICIVFVPVLLLSTLRNGEVSLHAAGHGGRLRHDRVLSAVTDVNPDVGSLSSQVRGGSCIERGDTENQRETKSPLWRVNSVFNGLFERLRFRYIGLLNWSLQHRAQVLSGFMAVSIASLGLAWLVGEDFFPDVDSGQMRLDARAPAGTRLEETEVRFAAIEHEIRDVIPASEMDTLIDNIGVVNCWACLAQGEIPTISSADGEILISLKQNHSSTRDYQVRLRKRLRERFPDTTFFFELTNITTQILNFGGSGAHRFAGSRARHESANYKIARKLADRISRHIPGAADVHVHQVIDQPEITLNVDRIKASQMGLTQRDVTSSMLISLSGSGQVWHRTSG